MKRIPFIFLLILVLFSTACHKPNSVSRSDEITVYCYDSFLGSWGAGEGIAEGFEKKTGIKVNLVGCGGSAEMYSKVVFEGSDCRADVVVGLSESISVKDNLFSDYREYDFGVFGFIWDSESNVPAPKNFADLTSEKYLKKVILVDPRTSSVGLGLLKWTIMALGEDSAFDWWKTMKDNCLTIASSWSSGYGIFTQGEAPLVISYTTSPVYHILSENTERYVALEFSDGHIKTSEFAGVLSSSSKQKEASLFIDYLLDEGQESLAVTNTMFPSNPNTKLPKAFEKIPSVNLIEDDNSFEKKVSEYLSRWEETLSK